MKPHTSAIKPQRGVTLTEVMIVVAIIGILAAVAVPSYQDMIERNRLKEAAESLANDLKFARTEAIKRSANVTLTLAAGWSYTITSGAATLKTVQGSQFQGIALNAATNVVFEPRRGTPAAVAQPILSSTSYQAGVHVNDIGRVTICTPTGATGLPGYAACPA
ncbi:MAG: GspH/FimT family pseudopilin [Methylobacter sp.]|nr:GspH/FimT family pseudopilin [Methylobacter sp.]MDP2099516.1 GspH/FimT family pseudopilin [Methylobacter sp.]MDP2428672.1 GspH/FimT family pseudopilin [Methylobacter sp.]MDP3055147.1 GspH/FimT family pseudopilin [Methylobacter sp.]MDP3364218.1 GspH/FimT family pseudopilin [Methylobacter sp.]